MDPDLDRLFDRSENQAPDEDLPEFPRHTTMIRCKCGRLVSVSIPARCIGCQESKAFWTTIDSRVIRLSDMKLDHLSNCIRMLAQKCEDAPLELREKYEVALDIMYAELGSRDKEIAQATGILAALRRNQNAE
ncbi:MAG TPA: hypothetical protein VIY48_08305 [Candidatus Paceibacterota bacterium]